MSRRHTPGRRPGDGEGDGGDPARSLPELRKLREHDVDRRRRRERGYRRAVLVGIAVSAVAHVLLVAFLSSRLRLPRMQTEGRRPPPTETAGEQRLVQVQEITEPDVPPRPQPAIEPPPPPRRPLEDQEEEEAPEARGEPTPAETEATGAEESLSNAERLKPKEGDGRLWREFWDENTERYLGGSARADSAIRAILGKYFDSLRVAREAYESARDWTVGEGDERWGVSPEGIHLGDITIPIPVNQLLSPTGPKRRQLERELMELRQIQLQERLRDVRETREERIEEMRERSREQSDPDTTGSDGGG